MKILVLSEGPPPLGSTIAEGGALRAWGIAKGLIANGQKDVTLAYRSSYDIAQDANKTKIPENLTIETWDGDKIDDLLKKHHVVILRYAMGEAWEITRRLTDKHILVADSYVPISIEVSARNSSDKNELLNYLSLQDSSAKTMQRADYILYASHSQLLYYLGYLSGINKLNPKTYQLLQKRMFQLPYGVDPSDKRVVKTEKLNDLTLLWYGAFYSWFDMSALIPSLIRLKNLYPGFKLLIAGAKNPYNNDPGLLAHYEKTVKELAVLGHAVEYIPWTSFDERFSIYARGSAILTFNHLGLENEVAWRTRLMDFVLADRPVLTNGGDPLGEDLINRGIAFRVAEANLENAIEAMKKAPPSPDMFKQTAEVYSWKSVTAQLSNSLTSATRLENGVMKLEDTRVDLVLKKIVKVIKKPVSAIRYLKQEGVGATLKLTKKRIRGR